MKIKEVIAELKKYSNQDAEVNFITNLIDSDNDAFDVENCNIDFSQQDVENQDSYDVYVYKDSNMGGEKIHDLLEENDELTIKLDKKDEYSNISVLNKTGDVLRDIQVGGRHNQHENIAIILANIL